MIEKGTRVEVLADGRKGTVEYVYYGMYTLSCGCCFETDYDNPQEIDVRFDDGSWDTFDVDELRVITP